MRNFLLPFIFIFSAISINAAVYEVKPNTPLDTIAEVPWATLQPGDEVLIYWKPTPYKEKWVISRQGTEEAPIVVRGVPNAGGELPVIDGNGAVTPTNLDFPGENSGIIKIGSANIPADTMPRYIVIENLEIRSAHPDYQFIARNGTTQNYTNSAAPIYIEKGEHITIRNNKMHDGANGFFVASSDTVVSRDILVDGNYIFNNGIVGSGFQHNSYTAAIGIIFQNNRFGLPRTNSIANNIKDRSAGLVIRNNWIEGGNRQLDLVEGDDSFQIRSAPEYHKTFVYGNILIEPNSAGNSQITHYGGDNGATEIYRKGTLYFYNNTVVSMRTTNTTLFLLSTNEETCDARNNIFYVTADGSRLALLDQSGVLILNNNWIKPGWRNSFATLFDGTITGSGTFVTGSNPGFVNEAAQDYHLVYNSPAVDAGTALNPDVLPDYNIDNQYVKHQRSEPRPVNGQIDIGAYEFFIAPIRFTTTALPNVRRGRFYRQTIQISGGSGNLTRTISAGSLPPGMYFDPATGEISGKAAIIGTYNFSVTVRDNLNPASTVTQDYTITVSLY